MRSRASNVEACCSFNWRKASSSAGVTGGVSSAREAVGGSGNSPAPPGRERDRKQWQVRRPAVKFGRLWRSRNMNDGLGRKLGLLPTDARTIIFNSGVEAVPHRESKAGAIEGLLKEVQPIHHREALSRYVKAVAADVHDFQHRLLRREFLGQDRKSTRLNSSHRTISYAVFCLKKK